MTNYSLEKPESAFQHKNNYDQRNSIQKPIFGYDGVQPTAQTRSPLKNYNISSEIQQAIEMAAPAIRSQAHVRFVFQ